jgi:hypothetical protein
MAHTPLPDQRSGTHALASGLVCVSCPVTTFCTSSSRADTARTRRRLLRPALAPASLRERAGRLARDTGCGYVREREARIVRSRPPSVQPAPRPDPSDPSVHPSLGSDRRCGKWATSGGAGRIGSKRLDPGPLRLLGPALPGRPGLPLMTRASLSLHTHRKLVRRWPGVPSIGTYHRRAT